MLLVQSVTYISLYQSQTQNHSYLWVSCCLLPFFYILFWHSIAHNHKLITKLQKEQNRLNSKQSANDDVTTNRISSEEYSSWVSLMLLLATISLKLVTACSRPLYIALQIIIFQLQFNFGKKLLAFTFMWCWWWA